MHVLTFSYYNISVEMLGKEVYAWQCYFFSFSYYQCRHNKIVLLFMDILLKMGCYGSQHHKVVFFCTC